PPKRATIVHPADRPCTPVTFGGLSWCSPTCLHMRPLGRVPAIERTTTTNEQPSWHFHPPQRGPEQCSHAFPGILRSNGAHTRRLAALGRFAIAGCSFGGCASGVCRSTDIRLENPLPAGLHTGNVANAIPMDGRVLPSPCPGSAMDQ